jgi:hypothetical protein
MSTPEINIPDPIQPPRPERFLGSLFEVRFMWDTTIMKIAAGSIQDAADKAQSMYPAGRVVSVTELNRDVYW